MPDQATPANPATPDHTPLQIPALPIVLLTNYSLHPGRDAIIEDIIWKGEIHISHLPNTNNPNRKYSSGRIFSPLNLQAVDANIHPNYQDLSPEEIRNVRGSLVESLFNPEPPSPNQPGDQHPAAQTTSATDSPWVNYLQILHTFLNYKAWLLWCAGDRDPLALQKSLLQRPESKLLCQKINNITHEALPHCRFFPSPVATTHHFSKPISGLPSHTLESCLDLHPTKNTLNQLRDLSLFGFTLVPTVQPTRIGGHEAYLIVEQGNLPKEGFSEAKTHDQKRQHLLSFSFVSQIYLIPEPNTPATEQDHPPDPQNPDGDPSLSELPPLSALKEFLPHIQLNPQPPPETLEKTRHVPTRAILEKDEELWTLSQHNFFQAPVSGNGHNGDSGHNRHSGHPTSDPQLSTPLQLNCPQAPSLPPTSFKRTCHLWRPIQELNQKAKEQRRLEIQQIQLKIQNLPKQQIFEKLRRLEAWNAKGDLFSKTTSHNKKARANKNGKKNHGKTVSDETWFPGRGNLNASTWIIGIYPSNAEIESDPPAIFIGPSGNELSDQLQAAGVNETTDIYLDNILRKFETPGTKPSATKVQEQCWPLKALICLHRPERLILLGADVLQVFTGKQVSFTERRKEWIDVCVKIDPAEAELLGIDNFEHHLKAAATYHPAYALRSENRHALATGREDMRQLLLGEAGGKTKPPELIRHLCREESAFQEVINEILSEFEQQNRPFYLGLDTEGENLHPTSGKTISLQLGFCPLSPAKDEKLHQATALFWEKPDPLQLTSEQVTAKIQEIEPDPLPEFEFSFVTALRNAQNPRPTIQQDKHDPETEDQRNQEINPLAPQSQNLLPDQETKAPLILVAWNEEQDLDAYRKAAKTGRALTLFQHHRMKARIPDQSKITREAFLKAARHPLCQKIVATNLNHDRAILASSALCIDLTELEPKLADTIIAEHIRDETANERGLKPTIERHLGWGGYEQDLARYAEANKLKSLSKSAPDPRLRTPYSLFPWSVLEKYSGLDPIGSALVYQAQEKDIERQVILSQDGRPTHNLFHAFNISMNAVHALSEIEKEGMPIDEEKFRALEHFYEKHEPPIIQRFQEEIFKLTGEQNVNPRSDQQLAYLLFNKNSVLPKLGIRPWKTSGKEPELWDHLNPHEQETRTPAVDAESLEIIAANCPDPDIQKLLKVICETKYILTLRDTFVASQEKVQQDKGMRGKMDPYTGRLHTTYMPTLDTARCRSVPNLSNIVRDETDEVAKILQEPPPCAIRDLVQAIPGHYFISRDWTTAEVLTLAYLSEDPGLLAIIADMKNGQDVHALLATEAFSQIGPFLSAYESSPNIPLDQIPLYINTAAGREQLILQYAARWHYVPENASAQYIISSSAKKKLATLLQESGNRPPTYTPKALTTGERHQYIKKVFKDLRDNVKPVTFKVPYGGTPSDAQKQINRYNFANNICDANGNLIKISLEAVQNIFHGYKKKFAQAWKYQTDTAAEALQNHQIQDRWGYIRHFPSGTRPDQLTRKAYNWPIQHGVAVVMNQAMHEWNQRRKKLGLKTRTFYTLYDALGWHVPEDELQIVWTISAEVMTMNRPVLPDRPWTIPTDGKIRTNWESGDKDPASLGVKNDPNTNLTNLENSAG